MISEIEAFLDEGVDIDKSMLAEPSRECSSMFLTIASARLPCWTTLSRLPRRVSVISLMSERSLFVEDAVKRVPQFVDQFAETPRNY